MDVLLRLFIIFGFTQVNIQLISSDVNHLTLEDSKCFPYGFRFEVEEHEFVRLIVVPYLDKKSISDISHLDTISPTNIRYSSFLSCMWKNRNFQKYNGIIDFEAIKKPLAAALGREVGDTGPGNNLSGMKAIGMVEDCKHLGGYSHGQKVVLVRNCLLRQIQDFVRDINKNA